MQNVPVGWTANDLQRFNAVIDAANGYMTFDYARKQVAGSNQFLAARQQDIGNLVLSLGNDFINQFGQN